MAWVKKSGSAAACGYNHTATEPIIGKHDIIHRTRSNKMPAEELAMATDNVYRKFSDVWISGF